VTNSIRSLVNASALIILFAFPAAGQSRWVVASTEKLDARISRQVQRLARLHKATLSFLQKAPSQGHEQRGMLVIEFEQEKNIEAFTEVLRKQTTSAAPQITPSLASQGYSVSVSATYPAGPGRIQLHAATPAGFHNALLRLPWLLKLSRFKDPVEFEPPAKASLSNNTGRNSLTLITDFPSFPERGIVEGFYGKPWSHEERLDMLRFEGEHGMNVYYYAPKDDPYHRNLWRNPYPPARMEQLRELVKTAHENFVDFCFAISPGLSMMYSSQSDFRSLTDKLDSVSRLGVSCFALFLDDVPQYLDNSEDLAKYKTLAAAHVDVINRLYTYLKSQSLENRLVVAPTTYTSAWGSRDYIPELGDGVNPDVAIVWTGRAVVSPEITVAEAKEWGELLRRKPMIWDNFPVNDGIAWRLNLGPLRGRDSKLPSAVSGFVSNPMIQAEASKLPLQTIAQYLWNSSQYDADAAYQRALKEQYGATAERRLGPFLTTYGDYWWDENIFQPLFAERRSTFDIRAIQQRIALLSQTLSTLREDVRYRKLVKELEPFPAKTRSRLPQVLADPAFEHLPDEKLRWLENYDVYIAQRVASPPKIDGDFAKWKDGKVYSLDQSSQIFAGRRQWRGPQMFSVRYALRWDKNHLYIGVDVTDPELYQPFNGRDIGEGDVISLMLETAFRRNFNGIHAGIDEYNLLISPGDFQTVTPSVYSQETFLPPRPVPRDYMREILTAWKKTERGFSGDLVLPAGWFDAGGFEVGYEVGLVVSGQKVLAPPGSSAARGGKYKRILLRSKTDRTFPARFGNPGTYQRIVFAGSPDKN
jgi:beta-N-acetylglucosaminidase